VWHTEKPGVAAQMVLPVASQMIALSILPVPTRLPARQDVSKYTAGRRKAKIPLVDVG